MDERGVKAIDLARKLKVDRGTVSHYLSGEYSPRSKRIHEIAVILDVQEAWLLGYDVPMERSAMRIEPYSEEIKRIVAQLNVENQQMALNMLRTMLETQKAQSQPAKKSV